MAQSKNIKTKRKKKAKSIELELTLMPTGELRFSRADKVSNKELQKLLGELSKEDLSEFFNGSNSVELIVGNENLCG